VTVLTAKAGFLWIQNRCIIGGLECELASYYLCFTEFTKYTVSIGYFWIKAKALHMGTSHIDLHTKYSLDKSTDSFVGGLFNYCVFLIGALRQCAHLRFHLAVVNLKHLVSVHPLPHLTSQCLIDKWRRGLRHCVAVLEASLQTLVWSQAVLQPAVIGSPIGRRTIGPASSRLGEDSAGVGRGRPSL
jgi:hypothetical protein